MNKLGKILFGFGLLSLLILLIGAPSETTGLRLSDGRIAIVGNPQDLVPDRRDPLFLALTHPNSLNVSNVYAIQQGISHVPTYPGFSKYGGAQYPSAVQVGNELYVSFSIHKEGVGFARLQIPGLSLFDSIVCTNLVLSQ